MADHEPPADPDVSAEERSASVDTVTSPSDADPATIGASARRRRGLDALTLLVGLGTLVMAVFAFVGELPDLPDPRWLLAGGAALVGLVLLIGSLRGRRGPNGG